VNCTSETSYTSVNAFGACFASTTLNKTCYEGSLRRRLLATYGGGSFARLLVTTFSSPVQPTVQALTAIGLQSSIIVTATLQSSGLLYCAALEYDLAPPTSVQDIVTYNEVDWTSDGSYTVNVTLNSLIPASKYYVYCASMTVVGVYSALSTAVTSRLYTETTCCRTVTFRLLYRSVFVGTSLTQVASINVDVLPEEEMMITLIATNANQSYSIILPETVILSSASSAVTSFSFAGTTLSGIYNLSVVLSGNSSDSYNIEYSNGNSLEVIDLENQPPIPTLSFAKFSNDGSAVFIGFDVATDRGIVAGLTCVSVFPCSLLFRFGPGSGGYGASLASCQWNSDVTGVTAIPSASYPLYSDNSSISLHGDLVRAACPSGVATSVCKGFSAAASATVVIAAPTSPIVPRVKVSLPNTIGACNSLKLDISGSTGSGGRTWASVNITFTTKASNTSALSSFLVSDHRFDVPIVISNSLLQKGSIYVFNIKLCNWLGSCGGSSASVNVLNKVLPYVSIVGGPTLTSTVNATLQLSSVAFVASCVGSQSTLDLQYSWSIGLVNNKTSTSSLSLVATSKDPSKYSLSAFQLTASSIYSVRLTVTSLQSYKSNSATVTIRVLSSDIIVIIVGGSQQTVRVNTNFSIDGSGTFDTGQANRGNTGLAYAWQCGQISPTRTSSCPMRSLGESRATSVLVLEVPASVANTTSIVVLTVTNSVTTSRGQVTVTAFAPAAPTVTTVTAFGSKVSSTAELVVQGQVTTAVACDAVWIANDASLDLSLSSSVPPAFSISASTSDSAVPLFLSLAASTLPVGSSVTFTLSCTDRDTGVASYAALDITTNQAPLPGRCIVTPLTGVSFSTSFAFTASSWIDDDTPLSYHFGFVSPITNASMTIQTKSYLSFAGASLPAGLSSTNYSLQVEFVVYDSFGAFSTKYVAAHVASDLVNYSTLDRSTAALLSQNEGSVDGLKQTISLIATALGTANCTNAPNCTALNRYDCAATANTCGRCVGSDYVGISGDSNTVCLALSTLAASFSLTTACGSDDDCASWQMCNTTSHLCADVPKDCPSDCSSNGICGHMTVTTLALVSVCSVSNPDCVSVCSCFAGYFGDDCSLSQDEWQTKQSTTSQLMTALQQVADLETLDETSAVFWINSMQSLTVKTYLLNDTAVAIARNISLSILSSSLLDSTLLSTSSTAVLAGVVSNIVHFSASNSTEAVSDNVALLDLLAAATISPLVLGEDQQDRIQASYRQIASITGTGRPESQYNMSLEIPRTDLEIAVGAVVPAVVNISASPLGSAIGVTSLPKYLLLSSSWTATGLNISSNGVRLNLNQVAMEASCKNATYADISFAHYEDEYFGVADNTSSSNETMTTYCAAGVASVSTYICSSGKTLFAHCYENSTDDHYIISACPSLMRVPQCKLTSSTAPNDAVDGGCTVISYSSATTICRCSLCSLSTASRRLTDSSLSTRDAATVVAFSMYTFSDTTVVVESASLFSPVGALNSPVVIIATFASLWLGLLFVLLGVDKYRLSRKVVVKSPPKPTSVVPASPQGEQQHHGDDAIRPTVTSKGRATLDSMNTSNLEDCLRDYISELFTNAFSEESDTVRLVQELRSKHQYFRLLLLPFGPEQWTGAFSLLTSLTISFYLVAVLYDLQYPTDDGSCSELETESLCLSKHSMFNPSDTKCAWTSTSSSTGTCAWRSPSFDVFTTVIVTIIVMLISAPLSMGIAWVCNEVLGSPSLSETSIQDSNVRFFRGSALVIPNRSKKAQIAQTPIDVETGGQSNKDICLVSGKGSSTKVQPEESPMNSTKSSMQPFSRRRREHVPVFFQVTEMTSRVKEARKLAHQHSALLAAPQMNADGLHETSHYRSYHSFREELCNFYQCQPTVEVNHGSMSLADRDRLKLITEFGSLWKNVLDESCFDGDHSPAASELRAVVAASDTWVHKLRSLPTDQAGVKILELFVRDCLGQHSMEASIFSQKIQPLKEAYVTSWSIKCVAFSCFVVADLYFIVSCCLYGREKEWKWQLGWLYTCLVILLVDMSINSISLATISHYFVPNLIVDKARSIRASVVEIVHGMCEDVSRPHKSRAGHNSTVRNAIFSSAAYFFVSAHVARAFPDLLESKIVLANWTFLLSDEQLSRVAPHYHRIANGAATKRSLSWSGWLGSWLTLAMLKFGSQPVRRQHAVISVLNPSILSLTAICGLSVSQHTVVGVVVGILIAGLLLFGLYHVGKHCMHEFKRGTHQAVSLSLAQREIDLFDNRRVENAIVEDSPKEDILESALLVPALSEKRVCFDVNSVDQDQSVSPQDLRAEQVGTCTDDEASGDDDDESEKKGEKEDMKGDEKGQKGVKEEAEPALGSPMRRLRAMVSKWDMEKFRTERKSMEDGDDDDEDDDDNDDNDDDNDDENDDDEDDNEVTGPNYLHQIQTMLSPNTPVRRPAAFHNVTDMKKVLAKVIAEGSDSDEEDEEDDGSDVDEVKPVTDGKHRNAESLRRVPSILDQGKPVQAPPDTDDDGNVILQILSVNASTSSQSDEDVIADIEEIQQISNDVTNDNGGDDKDDGSEAEDSLDVDEIEQILDMIDSDSEYSDRSDRSSLADCVDILEVGFVRNV
jgi:hypothetical protein